MTSAVARRLPAPELAPATSDFAPVVVAEIAALPLDDRDLALLEHFDGLRTVDEIASAAGLAPARVGSLVARLAWFDAVAFDEVMHVRACELVENDAVDDEPAPFSLVRRRRPEIEPIERCGSDASIAQAIVAALEALDASA